MKVCGTCLSSEFIPDEHGLMCRHCARHFDSADELADVVDDIPVEIFEQALIDGIAEIIYNEDGLEGIACRISQDQIGSVSFYFADESGEEARSVYDFFYNYCGPDNVPKMLYDCIGTPENAKNNGISYDDWCMSMFILCEYVTGAHGIVKANWIN